MAFRMNACSEYHHALDSATMSF
jgi:hypothetical protein